MKGVAIAIVAIALGFFGMSWAGADGPTVPDAPTITGVTVGLNAVAVDVTPNGDGGDAITGYTVTCTSSDGGAPESNSSATSPITVSSLTNGNTYSCTAHATNPEGDSAESDPSDDFVAITVPDAPSISSLSFGSNSVTVSFTTPADGGDPIIFYKVTCTSTTGGTTRTKTGAGSPITVTSLSNARTYTCTVVANNSVGASAASAASSSFVAGTTAPAPSISSVTRGNDSASVAVSPNGNGGSAITAYNVTCTSSDGGATQSNSAGSSPVSVSSLTDGKAYTCTATVTNAFGTSAASAASGSFVAAVMPDAPTLVSVTRGSNSASVAFSANGDGGDAITGFTATCTSSDGGTTRTASGASSPLTVGSLTNSKTYSCNVVATNGIGNSSPSSDSSSFVAATAPLAPSVSGVTRGDNSGIVAFSSNGDGGDAITSYTATCTSSDGGTTQSASGSSSPVAVGSLSNGNTYTCTVTATNAIGTSAASAASGSFVVAAVPDPPDITDLTRDDNAAIVSFSANSDGGDAITGFTATCTSSDGGTTQSNTDVGSPIEVSSLTNSKTYTCTVLATNSIGDGAPSTASSSFVAATVPNAPSVSGVTRGQNSGSVAFTSNGNGGDAITGYTATCTSSNGGTTRSASGGTSPIAVGSLTNLKSYTCTVLATNSFGNSAASAASSSFVAATTPSAPTVNGANVGSNSVSVDFSAGGNGGDAITSYTVTCTSSNGGSTQSNTGASSPIVVSALTNGKDYTCTVVATNGIGDSAASAASESFTVVGLADPPTITSVDLDADAVIIGFTPGADNGASVTGYTVTCTSSDGGTTEVNTDVSSPIEVDSLSPGNTYTCTMVATNSLGDSPASGATGAFTADSVPAAPSISSVTRGTNSAVVSFTPNSDGGETITDYKASCTSSTGGVTRSRTGTTSPITVSLLTNSRTYTCKVLATNGVGDSAWSAASSSFVAANVAAAPTIGVATRGSNSASVTFTANSNGGDAVTSFTVTCTSSDGGTTRSNTGGSSPIVVSSLTNGNTYTCTAVATNGVGDSAASAATSSFVAATTPSAPTIGAATLGSNSASVAFTDNGSNGATITNHTMTCTSSDGGTTQSNTGASSPIVVSALDNGKTYTCSVVATNAMGDSSASAATSSFVAGTVPDAPTIGTATRGSNSASVTFTDNGNGGTAITNHTVTCTSSDGGTTQSNTGASSPIVVSTLTNSKTYTCTAVATNAVGDSSASAATSSFVAISVPDAPTIGVATRGQNSVSVAFTDGATGGTAITNHTMTCTSSDGGTTQSNAGASSPIVVSTLDNGKTYTCSVVATNSFGTSAASAATSSFVAAASPTAATVSSVTRGQNSAIVAVTATANGDAITAYNVTCTSSNSGATESASGATSPITVGSLTNAKTYTCTVTATNGVGTSAASAPSASFVAATVPGAPTISTITHVSGSATVTFTAPASSGGSTITGYTVTCTSTNGGGTHTLTGTKSPITVAGLTSGKTYTCKVVANNAIGSSVQSNGVTFTD